MDQKRSNGTKKTNKNLNNRKTNKGTGKITYFPGLRDKPVIELAEQGIPFTIKLCPDTADDTPTLVDKGHYRKVYAVEGGKAYTLRMGIHSSSLGIAAMNEDTIVACCIPTTIDKLQHILSLFFIDELYPAKYMDDVWLKTKADRSFRIEYIYGSAAFESNNDSRAFSLSNDSVTIENDMIIIYQNGIRDEIPNCCKFFFDFLRIQIKVIYV
ncbi:MAG: hypothetical protein K2N44_18350 [Lachnospiraceae bacterium]|nr:hypothetical protein [Lachnospiraceae bacterium]